jgi:hypothetical protein
LIGFATKWGEIDFDVDEVGVYTIDGGGECSEEHVRRLLSENED